MTATRIRYLAFIGGSSFGEVSPVRVASLRAARDYAESYGTTADHCTVTNLHQDVVAQFRRDTNGNGSRWFRAVT